MFVLVGAHRFIHGRRFSHESKIVWWLLHGSSLMMTVCSGMTAVKANVLHDHGTEQPLSRLRVTLLVNFGDEQNVE